MLLKRLTLMAGALIASAAVSNGAQASLALFQQFNGAYGLSTDGGGSNNGDYTVSAFVPVGATVTAAYLYQATYDSTGTPTPVTLNGSSLTFASQVPNATACCSLASARADVTGLVSSVVNGGAGGTYNFTVGEGNSGVTDGTALVVVYSLASLPTTTVAILDGFASVTGDSTALNFADPLDPTAAGFQAEMRLGIGFSCCGQESTVKVNGTTITDVAGNNDDGTSGVENGDLITVGGNDDPFTPANPTYDQDHERYNLASSIVKGDTSIKVDTINASQDDNIFLAAFVVTGNANVNQPPPPPTTPGVPEPASWAMMIAGFGLVGGSMRRRSTNRDMVTA
jgi:hypothetical protein